MITYEGEKLICFEAGKQAGIREIVEWLQLRSIIAPTDREWKEWQAFKQKKAN